MGVGHAGMIFEGGRGEEVYGDGVRGMGGVYMVGLKWQELYDIYIYVCGWSTLRSVQ